MLTVNKKTITLLFCLVSVMLLTGCTNWKKKYQNLNVEHQNLLGRYERTQTEKDALAEEVSQNNMTIEELQKQINENKTPAEASKFGEGYDVQFDPAAGTVTVTLESSILFAPGKENLKKTTSVELDHIYLFLGEPKLYHYCRQLQASLT